MAFTYGYSNEREEEKRRQERKERDWQERRKDYFRDVENHSPNMYDHDDDVSY